MKVKWLGHAAFLIASDDGKRIVTDPYEPGCFGGGIQYGEIKETADIVTVSHDHADHNWVSGLQGNPDVAKGSGEKDIQGLTFKGIPTYHDDTEGSQRGENTIFVFEVDGVKVCHLGDLGHSLSDEQVSEIGPVDLLIIPVGGFYTIDVSGASKVVEQLNPKIVIPMHYKTESCGFPIAEVNSFLKDKERVKKLETPEVEVTTDELPSEREIVVLQHAL